MGDVSGGLEGDEDRGELAGSDAGGVVDEADEGLLALDEADEGSWTRSRIRDTMSSSRLASGLGFTSSPRF